MYFVGDYNSISQRHSGRNQTFNNFVYYLFYLYICVCTCVCVFLTF